MKKPANTYRVECDWLPGSRWSRGNLIGFTLLWVLLFFSASSLFGNCVISCRDINISLDPTGQAVLSPAFVLADPSCDPAEFRIEVFNVAGQALSDTLDCNSVGQVLDVKVVHQSTGNRCWSKVNVQDYLPPVIDCQDTLLYCTQATDPGSTGFPSVTDNCTQEAQIDLTYTDEYEDLPCYSTWQNDSVTARITRIWTAVDAHGNTSTCTQHIYLKRATVEDVLFPLNRDGFAAPKLNCLDDPTDLNLTGVPTVAGEPIDVNGACELVVSFSDQTIPQCGSRGVKILRTWTVIDWCSGNFNLDVQLISVADTTAPVLSCPADITVSTDYYECTATVVLPMTTATDDCSAVSIQPSWTFGSGFGPFNDVPVGTYEVTYTATDACGNEATCSMDVTVKDQLSPVAVCDANTVVALGNNGVAYVNAASFDDGSYDNCNLSRIEIMRTGGTFAPQVYFDCADIGQSIPVTLRVHDEEGNYNECTVLAEVKDLWHPAITCPDSIVLTCEEDYRDTDLTGVPLVTENCSLDTIYFEDEINLNACGVGSIRRRWWARDAGGNESWCDQILRIRDTTEINVHFPEDYLTYTCGEEISPDSSGRPVITGADCEQVGTTYSDQVFSFSGTSCYKVFRTWTVIDWCTYVPNSGSDAGSWTHTQLITLRDTTAPQLICPGDTTVAFNGTDCNQGAYVTFPPLGAQDCDTALVFSNDSPYAQQAGRVASGYFPVGTHDITFFATDGCGNTSSCQTRLTVADAKPPTPLCEQEISVSLNQDGYVLLDPSWLTLYVEDNCTAPEQIDIQLSRSYFTCDELGEQMVEIIYTDAAGNEAFCTVNVIVTDGLGVCPSAAIRGQIRTERGRGLAGTDVFLEGAAAAVQTTTTDGSFQFEQLPVGADYTVTPAKESSHRNGISTFDLILISKHIVGLQRFASPYKIIAADVNNSGSVSTFDVIELRKMILYINDRFPNSPSWRFIPEAYTFSNPANPFQSSWPESLSYQNLRTETNQANFVAVKVGDVNESARTDQLGSAPTATNRSEKVMPLAVKTTSAPGPEREWVEFRFTRDQAIAGIQLSLELPKGTNYELETGDLPDLQANNFSYDERTGELRLSWHTASAEAIRTDQLFFRLLLKKQTVIELQPEDQFVSEAYLEEEVITAAPVVLEWISDHTPELSPGALRCFPNPVRDHANLQFELAVAQECILQIVSVTGSLVYEKSQYYEVGSNRIQLERSLFKEGMGLYYCRLLKADGQSVSCPVFLSEPAP